MIAFIKLTLSLLLIVTLATSCHSQSGGCTYTTTALIGGQQAGVFNDSFVGSSGSNCQTVSPNFINFTYSSDAIYTMSVVYNPNGLNVKHGAVTGSSNASVYLRAGEVITGLSVFVGTYKNDKVIVGMTFFTNMSEAYSIGSVSGTSQTLPGLGTSYIAAFSGSSGDVINQIGADTFPNLKN